MHVKSAGRVIEIFEYFERIRAPASAKQIADAHAYPQSSTSILLRYLVGLGYLIYQPEGRTYALGTRLGTLGLWTYGPLLQEGRLHALMADLADKTGGRILIGTQSGLAALYLLDVSGRDNIDPPHSIKRPRPLARTGIGRLLLSRYPDSDILKIATALNATRAAEQPMIDRPRLVKQVQEVRRLNYSKSVGVGYGTVSIFLPVSPHGTRLAITVGHTCEWINAEAPTLSQTMRRSAERHLG